jgi:hypothetical protein
MISGVWRARRRRRGALGLAITAVAAGIVLAVSALAAGSPWWLVAGALVGGPVLGAGYAGVIVVREVRGSLHRSVRPLPIPPPGVGHDRDDEPELTPVLRVDGEPGSTADSVVGNRPVRGAVRSADKT